MLHRVRRERYCRRVPVQSSGFLAAGFYSIVKDLVGSSTPVAIAYVAGLLDSGEFIHRSELAEFVCEQCGFHDARGHAQLDGCLKALRELEASGHFALPA